MKDDVAQRPVAGRAANLCVADQHLRWVGRREVRPRSGLRARRQSLLDAVDPHGYGVGEVPKHLTGILETQMRAGVFATALTVSLSVELALRMILRAAENWSCIRGTAVEDARAISMIDKVPAVVGVNTKARRQRTVHRTLFEVFPASVARREFIPYGQAKQPGMVFSGFFCVVACRGRCGRARASEHGDAFAGAGDNHLLL